MVIFLENALKMSKLALRARCRRFSWVHSLYTLQLPFSRYNWHRFAINPVIKLSIIPIFAHDWYLQGLWLQWQAYFQMMVHVIDIISNVLQLLSTMNMWNAAFEVRSPIYQIECELSDMNFLNMFHMIWGLAMSITKMTTPVLRTSVLTAMLGSQISCLPLLHPSIMYASDDLNETPVIHILAHCLLQLPQWPLRHDITEFLPEPATVTAKIGICL